MCGIAGYLSRHTIPNTQGEHVIDYMNQIQRHRGPDGEGVWIEAVKNSGGSVGLGHQRLSIIDLSSGQQPMTAEKTGNTISYNGEIYNYIELREILSSDGPFQTTSDTEVILRAYERWGAECVSHLRGMFAFALWDVERQQLFVARDRFGIKPFYYAFEDGVFYFASEIKTLHPFLSSVQTHMPGLKNYFSFQFCMGEKTLFEGIRRLLPAYCGYVDPNKLSTPEEAFQPWKYWEVHYNLDWDHTEQYFIKEVKSRLYDSLNIHLRSDVPVAAYVSGGMDSSIVASAARELTNQDSFYAFNGKFASYEGFDESQYAKALADERALTLVDTDIHDTDFVDNLAKVIYHLDEPVAGPGSFPQYMVSKSVRDNNIKVVLGGQGGDELFGGYTRYLIAYFEQCIKGAIDGSIGNGNYVVTYESIIPNLRSLQRYKPLIQEFWSDGIFEERDRRYYRLINRSNTMGSIVNWDVFDGFSSFPDFQSIYWGDNVEKESYFDSMTHFDFKTLLPALLQVEDRMSMAHGIESRVPFLDHPLVELLATIPSNIKFQNGELKRLLKDSFSYLLPEAILNRKDKMGFPVPLKQWISDPKSPVRGFILDTFASENAKNREYLNQPFSMEGLMAREGEFSRNIWGLLSLELWQQQYHDVHRKAPVKPVAAMALA